MSRRKGIALAVSGNAVVILATLFAPNFGAWMVLSGCGLLMATAGFWFSKMKWLKYIYATFFCAHPRYVWTHPDLPNGETTFPNYRAAQRFAQEQIRRADTVVLRTTNGRHWTATWSTYEPDFEI